MIDKRVGRAILRFVEQHRGRATYREIRIGLTTSLNVPSELVIWNEVQILINTDKFLDNAGINPGDRDRLTVTLTSLGRSDLNQHDLNTMSFDPVPDGPAVGRDPRHDLGPSATKPKELEW